MSTKGDTALRKELLFLLDGGGAHVTFEEAIANIPEKLYGASVKGLVENPKINLLSPIPHIKGGPTILREIHLVADHNSYHIGQIILLRGLLGDWED